MHLTEYFSTPLHENKTENFVTFESRRKGKARTRDKFNVFFLELVSDKEVIFLRKYTYSSE